LPLPVGASSSAWSPAEMARQPALWTAVGPANADWNQRRVAGWNAFRMSSGRAMAEAWRDPRVSANQ
jgi:hypothetical protein